LISTHIYAYVIDPVDSKLEELSEHVQVKDTNTELKQGQPQCI
jgi:hypothetical protein